MWIAKAFGDGGGVAFTVRGMGEKARGMGEKYSSHRTDQIECGRSRPSWGSGPIT